MPGVPLSGEVLARIVQSLDPLHRRGAIRDLAALCRTSKAFQREAEIKLYEQLIFPEPTRAHLACRTVGQDKRLALLVRKFSFSYESRRPALPRLFWLGVQAALNQMHNLESLSIYDNTLSNTWILDPTDFKFQLKDANLRFKWDTHFVRFLESQPEIQRLQTIDHFESNRLPLAPGSLPVLREFDGLMMVGMNLLSSPITNMQLIVVKEVMLKFLPLLPRLSSLAKTLRGLNFLDLAEEVVPEALNILSSACPNLVHIGVLPLPPSDRHDMHHALMYMHNLKSIHLDVVAWAPHPNLAAQRALAAELKIYCPSIRHVVFWINSTRFRWQYAREWIHHVDLHLHPQVDLTWSMV
ncbi:hypothetical protein DXG03_009605 [Asterophora parasitica]|uniref:Uncharacterized protein n=1 Tax=Asterophora parasitica TaxID=117018 RepID=A0A9P7KAW2_9AGAR|nr:hypothetical protein DXG03_009605 [Asterophora parasitica]